MPGISFSFLAGRVFVVLFRTPYVGIPFVVLFRTPYVGIIATPRWSLLLLLYILLLNDV